MESDVRARDGADAVPSLHDHAESGEMARTLAILFFLVLAGHVIAPWLFARRKASIAGNSNRGPWPRLHALIGHGFARHWAGLVVLTAVASVGSIIAAGHSGAARAWEEYNTSGE